MSSATLTVWAKDDCQRLHEATLALLADVGVEVLQDERSLELFRALGASVEDACALSPRTCRSSVGECPA